MSVIDNKMSISFAFFGSSRFSVIVLNELKHLGFVPKCIVTTADKPKGRKLILTPNEVKLWAFNNKVTCFDPESFDSIIERELAEQKCDVFVVASYGKIIPENIIALPTGKTLNIHPSLLPKYRGASPLQTAMLMDDKNTGITIMRIDEKMDHGPIVSQKGVIVDEWPPYDKFEEKMAKLGAQLLAETLSPWIKGDIQETPQDHANATYNKKSKKTDGLLEFDQEKKRLVGDQYEIFRKIQAYHEWPQAYFLLTKNEKQIRIKIIEASYKDGETVIQKVLPEGSKAMSFADFKLGYFKD